MRYLMTSLAFLAVAGFAGTSGAVELRYRWTAGTTYRFAADSHDVVTMSGVGLNTAMDMNTNSVFSLKIDKVKPNGTAQGTLSVESFEVKDDSGRVLAGLAGLPKDAIKNLVEIDAKGNFTFKEIVYLVVDEEGQNLLVSGSAGPSSVNASAQAGDEKVSVYASFDPKTGRLSGGYTVEKIAKEKKRKKVAVAQDKPKVDVLPTQFLELLKLPDGDVTAANKGALDVEQPQMQASVDMKIEVKELTAARAKLRAIITSKTAAQVPVTEEAGEDMGGDDEMGGGMGIPGMAGIPGMGTMPGMGAGGAPSGQVDMSMKVNGDILMDFDIKAGMLNGISGTLETETNAAGMMKISGKTELQLKRL